MRIALVSHRYLPEHRAGVEVLTHSLAQAMKAKGHDPFVVCSGSVTNDESEVRVVHESYEGVPVRRLYFNWHGEGNYFRSAYRNQLVGEAINQLLKHEAPEIVHVTSCLFLSTTAIEAALKLNLPVVWTLTDYWPVCWKTTLLTWNETLCAGDWKVPSTDCLACVIAESRTYQKKGWINGVPPSLVAKCLYRLRRIPFLRRVVPKLFHQAAEAIVERPSWFRSIVSKVDALVAVNRFAFDFFRASGFPEGRLSLITQTIDPIRLCSRRAEGEPAEKEAGPTGQHRQSFPIRFGFIGRINRVKGADLLVQAFQLAKIGDLGELRLFGQFDDGSFRQQLERLALGDPRISFCGSFDPSRLGEILSQIDVLVVPSRWYETGPLTIVEAFAARVPVICTRLGEMESMVRHRVNGFVFERNSVADLAQAIQAICQTPSLIAEFSRNIDPIIPFDQMISEYEALYLSCLARRR